MGLAPWIFKPIGLPMTGWTSINMDKPHQNGHSVFEYGVPNNQKDSINHHHHHHHHHHPQSNNTYIYIYTHTWYIYIYIHIHDTYIHILYIHIYIYIYIHNWNESVLLDSNSSHSQNKRTWLPVSSHLNRGPSRGAHGSTTLPLPVSKLTARERSSSTSWPASARPGRERCPKYLPGGGEIFRWGSTKRECKVSVLTSQKHLTSIFWSFFESIWDLPILK